ncbi:hypothetical protein GCM10022419_133140 [Nonomuraea rosea]|uniref:Uncharacterized protein n=1 Tax=Nonomuraea rosea TaxID=638574 RepID=A0ABP7A4V3_9ACTN
MSDLVWVTVLFVLSGIGYVAAARARKNDADATARVYRLLVPLLLAGVGAGLHVTALWMLAGMSGGYAEW